MKSSDGFQQLEEEETGAIIIEGLYRIGTCYESTTMVMVMDQTDSLSKSFAVILKNYLTIDEIEEALHYSLSPERLGKDEDRIHFFIEYSLGFFIGKEDQNRLIILSLDPGVDVDLLFDLLNIGAEKTQTGIDKESLIGYFDTMRKVAKERRYNSAY